MGESPTIIKNESIHSSMQSENIQPNSNEFVLESIMKMNINDIIHHSLENI